MIKMKTKQKELFLDLDGLAEDGYFYTRYDVGGDGHSITIKAKNKEKFLDAYAKECRKRAKDALRDVAICEACGESYIVEENDNHECGDNNE